MRRLIGRHRTDGAGPAHLQRFLARHGLLSQVPESERDSLLMFGPFFCFGFCLLQWIEGPMPEVGDILRGQLTGGGSVRNVSMGWECEVVVQATHCDRAAIDRLLGL